MKRTAITADRFGKEAFAYLAITLLVMTTFYVSYRVSTERQWEKGIKDEMVLGDLSRDLEEFSSRLRIELSILHDSVLLTVESNPADGEARLDGLVEAGLVREMRLMIDDLTREFSSRYGGSVIEVLNWSVDSRPILGGIDAWIPGPGEGPGLTSNVTIPEIFGVNTSFGLDYGIHDSSGTVHLQRSLELTLETPSFGSFLRSRMDRFEASLSDGEFQGMVSYILGSLAQMRCMMGFGRSGVAGEAVPLSLLSMEEIGAAIDIAISVSAQTHLRAHDPEMLGEISGRLSGVPGGGGSPVPLNMTLFGEEGLADPALALMMAEGLYSRGNPPSIETTLRPLFYAALEMIVTKLFSYAGLEKDVYTAAGGLSRLFKVGVDAVNTVSSSLLGKKMVDATDSTALEIFRGLIERSPDLEGEDAQIVLRSLPGSYWNGSEIDGYPLIVLPPQVRTFEIGLSDGGPENKYWISDDGTIHNETEYLDPSEMFLGSMGNIYCYEVEYTFSPMEPPFNEVDLMGNKSFIRSLANFLGTGSGVEDDLESDLMERGRAAVRNAVDSVFRSMLEGTGDPWSRMWVGYDSSDHPPLDGEGFPMASMLGLQAGPLMEIVRMVGNNLLSELEAMDILSSLVDLENGYAGQIASYIAANYDLWADRGAQMLSCREEMENILVGNCTIRVLGCDLLEEDVICTGFQLYPEGGKTDISVIDRYPEWAVRLGLKLAPAFDPDPVLLDLWLTGVDRSLDEVMKREFSDGSEGGGMGVVRKALESASSRGVELCFSSLSGKSMNISFEISDIISGIQQAVMGDLNIPVNVTGGRYLVPVMNGSEGVEVSGEASRFVGSSLRPVVSIRRLDGMSVSLTPVSGTYNTDPVNSSCPYHTNYSVEVKGGYIMSYSFDGMSGQNTVEVVIPVEVSSPLQVGSYWPMHGIQYPVIGTFWDRVLDEILEAKEDLLSDLSNMSSEVLGSSLSSLREIPPIVSDLIHGKELELTEVARVLSNVTLDLSGFVRENVRTLIIKITEMGVKGVLNATCNLLGIDEIKARLDLGPYGLFVHTERKALMGGEGNILDVTLNVETIGMNCYMSFNRDGNGSFDFNGTVTFDLDPLFISLELDPFMLRTPHMVAIQVRYDAGDSVYRASIECPSLEEFRACEVSLGDTLGVEPFIPIPPLGVNAVVNAGFRMRYRMPSELFPHINEVRISGINVTEVELFNPRGLPVYSSVIGMEHPGGGEIATWRVEASGDMYAIFGLNAPDLWRWRDDIPKNGQVRIVLRSPSGFVWDDLEVNLSRPGWFSRDADGYGVWRYTNGTAGAPNGGALPVGIKTLLISIALSSIKEAWTEVRSEYDLGLDMIVAFIQRALDLFMERFLSVVRELVLDVRMFLSLEIEDATGSAGAGLELSFIADGEAVAEFLGWLYDNIKVMIGNLADPSSSGDLIAFPMHILTRCYIELMVFTEVEMPVSVSKMAPKGVDLPDSFRLAISGRVNLALPMKLLGKDVGGMYIQLGVYILDAADAIVSLFYELGNIGLQQDFYLLRVTIWEESIE